ncbi:hypothetical protein ACJJTC_007604 [Scirpophaga incertulas]
MRGELISSLPEGNAEQVQPSTDSRRLVTMSRSSIRVREKCERDSDVLEVQNIAVTKGDELNAELAKAVTERRIRSSAQDNADLFTNLRIEMALFENEGDRGRFMSQA